MKSTADTENIATTTTLLCELDRVLDHVRVMREIYTAYQRLHGIESITGDSYQTRKLRDEIERLESRLRSARRD